ncbi:hypothetical protein SDD30_11070 [Moorella naiadis]
MWVWSIEYHQICRIVNFQVLWGETYYRIWLPSRDAVVRVRAEQLKPLDSPGAMFGPHHVTYIAAAARLTDAMARNLLLAPVAADIIPLPHQIQALARAVAGDRVRYLLADEVGLGKTIEAGLIMRELKLRGLVWRTLVIVDGAHRLAQLEREQQEWSGRMEQQALFLPEMVPLLLLRVEEAGAG